MVTVMRRFAFVDRWLLPARPGEVFEVLADVDGYPRWWPEVRSMRRIDDCRGTAVVRSRLPMNLHLQMTRETVDPDEGVLRVGIRGDLLGWAQWIVIDEGEGTAAVFTQEVEPAKRAWRAAASAAPVLGRHLLVRNHEAMMHSGRASLARYLRTGPAGPAGAG
ncbi:SRPBCC family protein [Marihabitans asiaticum]|uniref:Polyketide cyclase/dehydrase/lipid transport protein n=2 Tax=Marihabitans asiaticum TaxID=415218 RepID=A0A560WDZ9_9MICO|nr:polyketide cyclase/dehydrase/lipid transport protein [Marihabitans asiaticum]